MQTHITESTNDPYHFEETITFEGEDTTQIDEFEKELRELLGKYNYKLTRGF